MDGQGRMPDRGGMQKQGLCFRMEAAQGGPHRIYLYDEIRKYGDFDWEKWDFDDSDTSAAHIREILDGIPDGEPVELHVNSTGGEVGEGVAIFNLLRQKSARGSRITGFVDGYAYSVAMDIIMAADEIHMGLGTSMFLHRPWAVCSGNAGELRKCADQLEALGEASAQLYAARATNATADEIREMMDRETCLSPEECLGYGFCDAIDGAEGRGTPGAPGQGAARQEAAPGQGAAPRMAGTFAEAMRMLRAGNRKYSSRRRKDAEP